MRRHRGAAKGFSLPTANLTSTLGNNEESVLAKYQEDQTLDAKRMAYYLERIEAMKRNNASYSDVMYEIPIKHTVETLSVCMYRNHAALRAAYYYQLMLFGVSLLNEAFAPILEWKIGKAICIRPTVVVYDMVKDNRLSIVGLIENYTYEVIPIVETKTSTVESNVTNYEYAKQIGTNAGFKMVSFLASAVPTVRPFAMPIISNFFAMNTGLPNKRILFSTSENVDQFSNINVAKQIDDYKIHMAAANAIAKGTREHLVTVTKERAEHAARQNAHRRHQPMPTRQKVATPRSSHVSDVGSDDDLDLAEECPESPSSEQHSRPGPGPVRIPSDDVNVVTSTDDVESNKDSFRSGAETPDIFEMD